MSTINKIKKDGILYDIEDKFAREELLKRITSEEDPTVPDFVKQILESDIANWNKVVENFSELPNVKILESGSYSQEDLENGIYYVRTYAKIKYKGSESITVKGLFVKYHDYSFVSIEDGYIKHGMFGSVLGYGEEIKLTDLLTTENAATKEYVDDSIATAITGALGGSY